jgi:hypothetical protein
MERRGLNLVTPVAPGGTPVRSLATLYFTKSLKSHQKVFRATPPPPLTRFLL